MRVTRSSALAIILGAVGRSACSSHSGPPTQTEASSAPILLEGFQDGIPDCDALCKQRILVSTSETAAQIGIEFAMSAYNSRDWCYSRVGNWCANLIDSTRNMISEKLVNDNLHILKEDSCGSECFINILANSSMLATHWAADWGQDMLNVPSEGQTVNQTALARLNETIKFTSRLPSESVVNSSALATAMQIPDSEFEDDDDADIGIGVIVPANALDGLAWARPRTLPMTECALARRDLQASLGCPTSPAGLKNFLRRILRSNVFKRATWLKKILEHIRPRKPSAGQAPKAEPEPRPETEPRPGPRPNPGPRPKPQGPPPNWPEPQPKGPPAELEPLTEEMIQQTLREDAAQAADEIREFEDGLHYPKDQPAEAFKNAFPERGSRAIGDDPQGRIFRTQREYIGDTGQTTQFVREIEPADSMFHGSEYVDQMEVFKRKGYRVFRICDANGKPYTPDLLNRHPDGWDHPSRLKPVDNTYWRKVKKQAAKGAKGKTSVLMTTEGVALDFLGAPITQIDGTIVDAEVAFREGADVAVELSPPAECVAGPSHSRKARRSSLEDACDVISDVLSNTAGDYLSMDRDSTQAPVWKPKHKDDDAKSSTVSSSSSTVPSFSSIVPPLLSTSRTFSTSSRTFSTSSRTTLKKTTTSSSSKLSSSSSKLSSPLQSVQSSTLTSPKSAHTVIKTTTVFPTTVNSTVTHWVTPTSG